MNLSRTGTLILILALALLTGACGTLQVGVEDTPGQQAAGSPTPTSIPPSDDRQPTPPAEDEPSAPGTQRHTFKELGLAMQIPSELYVIKDPSVSLDDPSRLEAYLFYIQNYGYPGGPSSGDFQIYGLLQFTLPILSWEDFAQIQNETTIYEYVTPIEINGLRGFETKLSGERANYVYLFHLADRVLRIAVSSPTPENKALADQILGTLELLPGGPSDASHMKLVKEPHSLYQILIPEDWTFTFNPSPQFNLSEMEASSPDSEVVVEEVGGPHSNIHYKHGIFMTFVVQEGDYTQSPLVIPNARSQKTTYFNGIEGTEYVFVEPSTVEGELRQVHISHAGKIYVLRFGYAGDADQDKIDQIIRNLTLQD